MGCVLHGVTELPHRLLQRRRRARDGRRARRRGAAVPRSRLGGSGSKRAQVRAGPRVASCVPCVPAPHDQRARREPPVTQPRQNIWVSHAHTRTDDGHVVTAAAIGMDAQALLRAWRAAGNRAWLEDAETLLGAVNPASNLLGLWDRKDGGYFYGVVFKGATYDTAHDPTVRDRTKEAGRQQQVLLAARLADLATGGAYSSLVSELAQVATERAYYAAGHGFLYQEQSDWQPVVRKGEVKNFVTTEAMGIAIEALFALGTPSPW